VPLPVRVRFPHPSNTLSPAPIKPIPFRRESMPCGHESIPRGRESMPRGHESIPRGRESMPCGHESIPRGHESVFCEVWRGDGYYGFER
jgi:hypothetical protein